MACSPSPEVRSVHFGRGGWGVRQKEGNEHV